jgi:ribosomal protein L7/L12
MMMVLKMTTMLSPVAIPLSMRMMVNLMKLKSGEIMTVTADSNETIRDFITRMSLGAYKYRKLELLKIVRTKTGLGFKDAKDLLEDCTRRK